MKHTAEFDISTLIYIVLAVVAAIASIFQKKNEEKASPKPETSTKSNPWNEVFETAEEEPSQEYNMQPEPVVQGPSKAAQAMQQKANDLLFRSKSMETYAENESFVFESYQYEDVIKSTEIGSADENKKKKAIHVDLKTAIIYSEIMHKKY